MTDRYESADNITLDVQASVGEDETDDDVDTDATLTFGETRSIPVSGLEINTTDVQELGEIETVSGDELDALKNMVTGDTSFTGSFEITESPSPDESVVLYEEPPHQDDDEMLVIRDA